VRVPTLRHSELSKKVPYVWFAWYPVYVEGDPINCLRWLEVVLRQDHVEGVVFDHTMYIELDNGTKNTGNTS